MRQVLAPFFRLATALRSAGFPVAPDQTQGFIAAVGALGPRDIGDVRSAALGLFAIPPERVADFDAIFDAVFSGRVVAAAAEGAEDDVDVREMTGDPEEVEVDTSAEPRGGEAVATERLGTRAIVETASDALARLAREAPKRLPRRLSYRRQRTHHGDRIDLRRALRQAARQEGDVLTLPQTRRKTRQRRIILLIDVSGSMKEFSDRNLSVGHALVQAADRAEAFTLGTRLTRITPALRLTHREAAVARAGEAIADIDGGTRIGAALAAFLDVPRFAGFARGALVVVLSDGLERGDPTDMTEAVRRLSRLCWQLHWLTPLAADPGFRPETEALVSVLPVLDRLSDGASIAAIADHLLNRARAA
ncbi:vWA domain-containing protein [Roseobacter sinensis]|uniref:VWA domain-containing protein n=1 Tax=Roseobacter sinensis TaxID=2931391 RepID=A0ABT3BIK7_9RHOB|nr:VWA domain-containing protein [Roseobacter sp. WL0113]MCV3273412.1 VWA domain-containing protein [Roseobacter sp. WL0113]